MPPRARAAKPRSAVDAALDELAGPTLVLDAALRVVSASPSAAELLGEGELVGASAPKVLCGTAAKRPLAEAMAEGRPVTAVLPRPGPSGTRRVRVRATPVRDDGEVIGWTLTLDDAGEHLDGEPELFFGMWTADPKTKELFRVIERVADDDVTVLVRGETGTGKELVAKAIHKLSGRKDGPFRALNCAALPANLLESELFGHVRGAFTGATRDTPGHVELAHGGTLFLDEVAELPLELQAKLLRVIETRTFIPVGAREPVPVDIRLVSATHRALRREVAEGRFRADLMYRLRVIPVFLPPLRDRRGDIALLCEKLFETMNATKRRKVDRLSPAALAALERHDWPGNVRELKNVLAYAYAIGDGPVLLPKDLPPELLEGGEEGAAEWVEAPPAPEHASEEARRILSVLERVSGEKARAAKILGMSRVTLWRRMKALGLEEA